jgi:hypothetical protein
VSAALLKPTCRPRLFLFCPPFFSYRTRPKAASRPRLLGVFARGLLIILAALLRGDPLPFGDFVPLPWPSFPSVVNIPTLKSWGLGVLHKAALLKFYNFVKCLSPTAHRASEII